MKKSLSVLVAGAMVSSLFASVAFASELTTQQKYEALVAAGVFDKDGTGNGAELDAKMTREQLAKILAKLNNLKEQSGTSYGDVAADRWSAGFIQAVSKANPPLMEGVWDGVFNPEGNVTLEQLATVAVRSLGLEVKAGASVSGSVSDWAKGYVATAVAAGLLPAKSDYTAAAIRTDLVVASYEASQVLAAPKVTKVDVLGSKSIKVTFSDNGSETYDLDTALTAGKATDVEVAYKGRKYTVSATYNAPAVSVKATGAKKLEVTFNKAVDDTKATFAVKKGTIPVNVSKTTWNADKTVATVELVTVMTKGEYSVVVGGVTEFEQKVSVDDEKVTKIEFASDKASLDRNDNSIVRAQLKVYNQYDENVTNTNNGLKITVGRANIPDANINLNNGVLTLDSTTNYTLDEKFTVSALHSNGTFASAVLTVAPAAKVATVNITELYHADKKTLDASMNSTVGNFYLLVDAKDQYGNSITTPADVKADTVVNVIGDIYVDDGQFVTVPGINKLGLQLAKPAADLKAGKATFVIISTTTGNKATYDVTVKDVAKVDVLTLSAPELAVNGEKIEIPFTAVDQFGAEIKSESALKAAGAMLSNLTVSGITYNSFGFEQDYVNGKARLYLDLTGNTPITSAQNVFINGVTSTGKLVQLTVNVQPNAKPVVITGVTDLKTALAPNAQATIARAKINVLDQYGRTKTADKFADHYVKVELSSTPKVSASNLKITADDAATAAVNESSTILTADQGDGTTTVTLKLFKNDDTEVQNSAFSTSVRAVKKTDITDFAVADVAKLFATDIADYVKAVTVDGLLADGTKVAIQAGDSSLYTITPPSDLAVTVSGSVYAPQTTYTAIGANKEKTVQLVVTGFAKDAPKTFVKDVVISTYAPVATTLAYRSTTSGVIVTKESEGVISVAADVVKNNGATAIANAAIKVTDQYGVEDKSATKFASVTASNFSANTISTVVAGNTFNITAITANGKVMTFKVIVK